MEPFYYDRLSNVPPCLCLGHTPYIRLRLEAIELRIPVKHMNYNSQPSRLKEVALGMGKASIHLE